MIDCLACQRGAGSSLQPTSCMSCTETGGKIGETRCRSCRLPPTKAARPGVPSPVRFSQLLSNEQTSDWASRIFLRHRRYGPWRRLMTRAARDLLVPVEDNDQTALMPGADPPSVQGVILDSGPAPGLSGEGSDPARTDQAGESLMKSVQESRVGQALTAPRPGSTQVAVQIASEGLVVTHRLVDVVDLAEGLAKLRGKSRMRVNCTVSSGLCWRR